MRSERLSRTLAYALSRREAYLIVGLAFLAVVVAILGGWPAWVIAASMAAGAILLLLLVLDSLTDPEVEREASIADVEPGRVRDMTLRNKLHRALEYVRAAQKLARQDERGILDSADDELPQMEEAARSIYRMSLRLQEFRADRLLQRDMAEFQKLRSRSDRLSEDRRGQMDTLERLEQLVRTAEQEIDAALAHLGQSYAEMQAIKVTPELRGRERESLQELSASTRRLSDLAEGYDEAYGSRGQHEEPRPRG